MSLRSGLICLAGLLLLPSCEAQTAAVASQPLPESPINADETLPLRLHIGSALAEASGISVEVVSLDPSAKPRALDLSEYWSAELAGLSGEVPLNLLPEEPFRIEARIENSGLTSLYTASFPHRPAAFRSSARHWNEVLLEAIRLDTPRPPVHARNLYHLSLAMWDCWVAYSKDEKDKPFRLEEKQAAQRPQVARQGCIALAAHRLLSHRFKDSISAEEILPRIDQALFEYGYPLDFEPDDLAESSPEALGLRIAQAIIDYGLQDGSGESSGYQDESYTPTNAPLLFRFPGVGPGLVDPNRWSPLAFEFACLQNGLPLPFGDIQDFVGAAWGSVEPFALQSEEGSALYLDPGPPPVAAVWDDAVQDFLPSDAEFAEQMLEVVRFSGRLDPDHAPVLDLSPSRVGNNSFEGLLDGEFDGEGYPLNPSTELPYPPNLTNEADYGRVIAEFWADGPDSETPPGHWNVLANAVSDHPDFVQRLFGEGPILDDFEWDVRLYLVLNGSLHDAAIAAWGSKRAYDYVRPIAGIRWLVGRGQSSDPLAPRYDPLGMPLEEGLSELITIESSSPGGRHEHLAEFVNEVAFNVWPGEPDADSPPSCTERPPPPDPDREIPAYSGRRWIRGLEWVTYQRRTFVTPPFAAYPSGHSAFSRAGAVVLSELTGSPFFPGGFGEYVAPRNDFLIFETGPTETVRLQWATYFDAADEAGISRFWGGIHIAADDFAGRWVGEQVGRLAVAKAKTYWGEPSS
ncbi:MAG: vanadium-dependent haloperoxidase [Myxococcota bacterium]|nr:vanadium-dependent haloperoxidase [Myxococcota bacterium]